MARKDAIEVEGTVVELLPNIMLRVYIPGDGRLLGYISGKFVCISFGSCQETKLW
jgi:translation initiation factor IF-1